MHISLFINSFISSSLFFLLILVLFFQVIVHFHQLPLKFWGIAFCLADHWKGPHRWRGVASRRGLRGFAASALWNGVLVVHARSVTGCSSVCSEFGYQQVQLLGRWRWAISQGGSRGCLRCFYPPVCLGLGILVAPSKCQILRLRSSLTFSGPTLPRSAVVGSLPTSFRIWQRFHRNQYPYRLPPEVEILRSLDYRCTALPNKRATWTTESALAWASQAQPCSGNSNSLDLSVVHQFESGLEIPRRPSQFAANSSTSLWADCNLHLSPDAIQTRSQVSCLTWQFPSIYS